jgi:D-serine deaminase-like pyridoxal phosphate-dependent protein
VVGQDKGRRLLRLAERVRLAVGTDSVEGARTLAEVFAGASRTLELMLKIDVGYHRVGVEPDRAVAVARQIADLPGVVLRGVFTHAGQAYAQETPEGVDAVAAHEGQALARSAEALRDAGIGADEVSVGSTPTARHAMSVAGVTECRPGTTCSTTRPRWRSGPASPRTARSPWSRPS